MSAQAEAAAQAAVPAAAPVRPFYWSVRRELWEHRAVYLAPLAAGAISLVGFLISLFRLPHVVAGAATMDPKKLENAFHMPYVFVAFATLMIGLIVAVFYCLGALNNERRDRSLLFWKSLPVSDRTTVLAKAFVPLVVQPVVVFAVIAASQAAMLILGSAVVLMNGLDPTIFWARVVPAIGLMWLVIPYGLILMALWHAPIYGWLLLVSAWAKRMTFVWAVAPWLALALLERLALGSTHVIKWLEYRLFGGFGEAFSLRGEGRVPIEHAGDLDPARVLGLPDIWLGLAFTALFLFAAIRLRRSAEPI